MAAKLALLTIRRGLMRSFIYLVDTFDRLGIAGDLKQQDLLLLVAQSSYIDDADRMGWSDKVCFSAGTEDSSSHCRPEPVPRACRRSWRCFPQSKFHGRLSTASTPTTL